MSLSSSSLRVVAFSQEDGQAAQQGKSEIGDYSEVTNLLLSEDFDPVLLATMMEFRSFEDALALLSRSTAFSSSPAEKMIRGAKRLAEDAIVREAQSRGVSLPSGPSRESIRCLTPEKVFLLLERNYAQVIQDLLGEFFSTDYMVDVFLPYMRSEYLPSGVLGQKPTMATLWLSAFKVDSFVLSERAVGRVMDLGNSTVTIRMLQHPNFDPEWFAILAEMPLSYQLREFVALSAMTSMKAWCTHARRVLDFGGGDLLWLAEVTVGNSRVPFEAMLMLTGHVPQEVLENLLARQVEFNVWVAEHHPALVGMPVEWVMEAAAPRY